MLDLNAIKEKIDDLTIKFGQKVHLLTIKVGTGEDYSREMHECQVIVSEMAELEKYLQAFSTIKEED